MRREKEEKLDKKENKKNDKFSIWGKILAAFLIIFMLLGTCYSFIYLLVNA